MFMSIQELTKKLDMLNEKREEISYEMIEAENDQIITLEESLDQVEDEIASIQEEIYIKRRALKGKF